MKILLLGFGKISYMPYMNFYLDIFKEYKKCELELIYWDRDGKPDIEIPTSIKKAYKFEAYLEEKIPFKHKLKYFAKYRQFALKVLKKNKYDLIIVLHTTPGLTLLDYLGLHYKNKYILDFRDISYEYISLYRKLVGILSKNSLYTYVSSDAFRKFLPKETMIYTIHNYLEDSLKHRKLRSKEKEKDIIRISYWGLIRQAEINKKLMDALGNDSRFELHYYGRIQQEGREMMAYVEEKKYTNIYFHGTYIPEDRYEFAQTTDMIHNIYDRGYTTGNAMGNKFYDGIIFEIPQICTDFTQMGNIVSKRNVGISVDYDNINLADDLWKYYHNIPWEEFEGNCERVLEEILHEQDQAKLKLMEIVSK